MNYADTQCELPSLASAKFKIIHPVSFVSVSWGFDWLASKSLSLSRLTCRLNIKYQCQVKLKLLHKSRTLSDAVSCRKSHIVTCIKCQSIPNVALCLYGQHWN